MTHSGNLAAGHDRRILVAALGAAAVVLAGSGFGAWQMRFHQSVKLTPGRDAAVVRQMSERIPATSSPATTSGRTAEHSALLVFNAAAVPVDVDRAMQSMNGFLAFNGIAPLQQLPLPVMATASSSGLSQARQSMNAILAANGVGPLTAEMIELQPADTTAMVSQAVQSMNAFLAPNGVPPLTAVYMPALAMAAP